MVDKSLNIAMFGHKHVLSREGGIEIVVNELSTRMVAKGHHVVCYDRKSNHVNGKEITQKRECKGVKIIPVWTVEKKGLAAMTSSLSAAWSKADVIYIHAESPAAMCWISKLRGKQVTVHGACEIMGTTGEKPVKSRLREIPVFYPNLYTEDSHISISFSGGLIRLCAMPVAKLWNMHRAFLFLKSPEKILARAW